MLTHILDNEHMRVTVADAGAELISVYDKARRRERIWTGEPEVWNRHAPILFPFVGKVMNGKYRIGDREYDMKTQHGFARDMEFSCTEETALSVTHRLAANERTRPIYPWEFRLTVRHRLEEKRLYVEWTAENCGDEKMFFAIGGHPGFLLPDDVPKESCSIMFPGMDEVRYISTSKTGFALPGEKTIALNESCIRYRDDIPDTWIFEDNQIKQIGIVTPDGRTYVMMNCEQFPMLAVWANPKGPFICLEPWFGRTDDDGFTGTIDQKKGIQSLDPGTKKEILYSIDF